MAGFQQVKANANIYFIKNKNWLLSTALNYRYTSLQTENPEVLQPASTHGDFHYHSEALTLSYFSKLLGKTSIYSASLSTDGSDEHFERIRGMVTASLILKANSKTKMMLGLAGIIDPSSQIPILPIFTYENRFSNGWVLDVLLPKKILVRKNISNNGRVSIGTEMDNTSYYIYHNNNTYEFRQIDLNSGAIYEHNLGGNLMGTFKAGIKTVLNTRVFNKEESFKNYIWEASYQPSFYFNAGISYNPFGRSGKK
ncbi:MAG: DUF6268 family outer membrane beta-barrel protein [Chryseobacterium sp.]|uniref:DUF6268 family outer membrane beta-barrel protein n=1 Tax=Chryseobacterium sp. TaxID=1871047 RepID=UPI0025BBBD02|nr:DUF6268 family outer membrane beta-barrel protein [Chryseobacterium sp.]MCJ7932352.1 DUF6268 family outer membrane beta-barrel protein [Chryseobacterium sp.]